MRVLLWHGWLLEGSGSNVYTAKTAQVLRRQGHDVLLLCQESEAGRVPFVDARGTVSERGISELSPTFATPAPGRLVVLRPEIGSLLPVFVIDEYEGFDVRRFVDLADHDLERYLDRNVQGLRAAAAWHRPDVVVIGHAVPGAVIGRRALGPGGYLAKVHGSDLEYAIRPQTRYLRLAREGLEGAIAVTGASHDVLRRAAELVPSVTSRMQVVPPGVEVDLFRPMPRREALEEAARRLEATPETVRGRPDTVDLMVAKALDRRDGPSIDDLGRRYDQTVADPSAARRLRELASFDGPLAGYIGKFIPQKGVHLMIGALTRVRTMSVRALLIGFGLEREWLTALVCGLDRGDPDAVRWIGRSSRLDGEFGGEQFSASHGLADRVTFTGRLDHRFAWVIAALDVLVVPSVLDEAFGMVVAEGASAGALPLVARHSGLAEVAAALEAAVGRPGLFSYRPGQGSIGRLAEGLDRLLGLDPVERADLRSGVSAFVAREWTWERTAERLLAAARMGS